MVRFKYSLNEQPGEKSMMRRTSNGNESFLLRLSWGNADAAGFWALGGQAAARFSGVVAKVRPVNTA